MSTTEIGTRHSMEPERRTVQLYQQVLSVNISADAYGLTPFLRFTFSRVPQILAFESVFRDQFRALHCLLVPALRFRARASDTAVRDFRLRYALSSVGQ